MKLIDILDESCFGTISTIIDETSLDKLNLFIEYNKGFINRFQKVIVSLNWTSTASPEVIAEYKKIWSRNVPNAFFLSNSTNRGHMFGTIDLEEAIFKYVKDNHKNIRYIWKSMDDVLIGDNILDTTVELASFYYIPGFSYESIIKAGGKDNLFRIYEDFDSGFWTPQTTFFIIDTFSVSNLYGNDIDKKYNVYTELKKANPNIKPWEIPFDIKFDCETHLGRTTKNLTKYCLLVDKFDELLNFVDTHNVGDPSHKNIFFSDLSLCHYHFYKDAVFHI